MKIVVDIARQELTYGTLAYPVSTSKHGVGEKNGSFCTPRGRHIVRARIGAGQPLGAVFVRRRPTGEVWSPALHAKYPGRDWMLTRILWLSGCEVGKNRLGDVDTMRRMIYIHGTHDLAELGKPGSHGCIRMHQKNALALIDRMTGKDITEDDVARGAVPANEMILFRRYSHASRRYGVPSWIPAVASVTELAAIREYNLSFYESGGLADMLDMLSMCLGGGMSISASLEHVAKNLASYPALSEELSIMRRQTDVGSLRIALADWANRIDTPEVRQVATLLARGESLGTSLSGSLLDQADHFRTAKKQLATLQANRMPVLLTFPLLFCFAPAVLIILMSPALLQVSEFLNPENGNNPLANNGTLNTRRIVNTLNDLSQDVSAANQPPVIAPDNGSE